MTPMPNSDARKRHPEPPKENPMTDDLRIIREEAVTASDLLAAIRDLLAERLPSNDPPSCDCGAADGYHSPECPRAQMAPDHAERVPDTGYVTEEPPVGSQVTDCHGDVWERREDGWYLWDWPVNEWGRPGAWGALSQDYAPLRLTTDEDRERVGLPVDASNGQPNDQINTDPDEALARLLYASRLGDPEVGLPQDSATLDAYLDMARAAREHIYEHDAAPTAHATAADAARRNYAAMERERARAEEAEARHEALRADLEACRNASQIEDILDRDDKRGQS